MRININDQMLYYPGSCAEFVSGLPEMLSGNIFIKMHDFNKWYEILFNLHFNSDEETSLYIKFTVKYDHRFNLHKKKFS